jgi:hypothetical protein
VASSVPPHQSAKVFTDSWPHTPRVVLFQTTLLLRGPSFFSLPPLPTASPNSFSHCHTMMARLGVTQVYSVCSCQYSAHIDGRT